MSQTEYHSTNRSTSVYHPEDILHILELRDALRDAIEHASTEKHQGALFVLSLENLPMIIGGYSNTLSEEIFSLLLAELKKASPGNSIVERTDKTHIAILLPQTTMEETEQFSGMIYRITQEFGSKSAPAPIHLMVKMASVTFPDAASNLDGILEKICIALHAVKHDALRNYLTYAEIEKRETQAKHQMILANYMQNAIQNNKLRLAFQPIINSQTGHIIYHESLLRIVGDDGKINSAGPFIPIAEAMGFIDVVDDIVLEMVIEELRNSPDILLAFNISNLTVMDKNWLAKAKKLMADPDIASRLVVEMTETAMHGELRKVSYFVATLQDLGCQIAIDDFGAGYTSFRQLKSLPVDIVKIDGYFVKDIVDNSDNRLFVKTLLDFTRGLGLKAVAEFVETGEIAKLLMELKVDYMQGNYFCPAVNYRSWVKGEKYI